MALQSPEVPVQSPAQLREHYQLERELSDRLRHAPKGQRRLLYASVYEELFTRLPHHPQLVRKLSRQDTREYVEQQLGFLGPFLSPASVFLEVGAGDCALSHAVAGRVKQVYALDVSDTISRQGAPPPNFELVLFDGIDIPLPDHSVDVAYSNQLIEHLHPEDALDQLRSIHRVLVPGGAYLCITPHRLSGPHDVSKYFDKVATGFHLVEYTPLELARLFQAAGFAEPRSYLGGLGRYIGIRPELMQMAELPFRLLPRWARSPICAISRFGFLRTVRLAVRA